MRRLFYFGLAIFNCLAQAQTNCAKTPSFALNAGYSAPILSTSDRMRGGMVLFKQGANGQMIEPYQHPSWKRAGRLGGFVVTERGEIFVVPVPNVNTLENPPERQNILQRVAPENGDMGDFATIAVTVPPSQTNPYGLVGIAYDCKRRLIYLTTLSGSDPKTERGKVVVISADSGAQLDELSAIDGIGIGVFDGDEHFAIIGSARSSELYRVELGQDGRFISKPAVVARLDDLNIQRARKIRFRAGEMIVETTEFYYNLVAQTEFEVLSKSFKIQELSPKR